MRGGCAARPCAKVSLVGFPRRGEWTERRLSVLDYLFSYTRRGARRTRAARIKTRWNDRLAIVKSRVSAVRRQSRMRKEPAVKEGITWVGLDAHKKSISVAMLRPEGRQGLEWEVPHEPAAVKRLARKLEREAPGEVRCCYEAGPCGYTLQRRLLDADNLFEGGAPPLLPLQPGEDNKNHPRDARQHSEPLRAGLLTGGRPPPHDD